MGRVARRARAAAFIGGDDQRDVVDTSAVIGVDHGVFGTSGAVAKVPDERVVVQIDVRERQVDVGRDVRPDREPVLRRVFNKDGVKQCA